MNFPWLAARYFLTAEESIERKSFSQAAFSALEGDKRYRAREGYL
jgi:hypothetical protein